MLDTIKLYTEPKTYNIENNKGWKVIDGYYSDRGELFLEKKTKCIGPLFLAKNNGYLFITFTMSKLLKGKNFCLCPYSLIHTLPDKLDKYLRSIGIRLSVANLKVGRLDIYKDISVPESGSLYVDYAYNLLDGGRYEKRLYEEFNAKTVNLINKSKAICIYDKRKQMLNQFGKDIGKEMVRAEVRLLKSMPVKKYGFKSLKDLIDYPTGYFKKIYNAEMRSKMIDTKKVGMITQEDDIMKIFMGKAANDYGIELAKEKLKNQVACEIISKKTYYRRLKEVREAFDLFQKCEIESTKNIEEFKRNLLYQDV